MANLFFCSPFYKSMQKFCYKLEKVKNHCREFQLSLFFFIKTQTTALDNFQYDILFLIFFKFIFYKKLNEKPILKFKTLTAVISHQGFNQRRAEKMVAYRRDVNIKHRLYTPVLVQNNTWHRGVSYLLVSYPYIPTRLKGQHRTLSELGRSSILQIFKETGI